MTYTEKVMCLLICGEINITTFKNKQKFYGAIHRLRKAGHVIERYRNHNKETCYKAVKFNDSEKQYQSATKAYKKFKIVTIAGLAGILLTTLAIAFV